MLPLLMKGHLIFLKCTPMTKIGILVSSRSFLVKIGIFAFLCMMLSFIVLSCQQNTKDVVHRSDSLTQQSAGTVVSDSAAAAALSLDSLMQKEEGLPVQVVHTADYIVRIDRLSNGSYRYNSWKVAQGMTGTPSRVVGDGRYDLQTDSYYFHDRVHKITYIVGNPDFKGDDVYVIVREGNQDVYYQKTSPLYEEPETNSDITYRLVRTKEHTVRIDKVSMGVYRYTAWKTGKQQSDEPDLVLEPGSYDRATHSFYFQTPTKAYTYIVGNPEGKDKNLYLIVQHEGETISRNLVLEVKNGKLDRAQDKAGDLKLVKTPEYIIRISRNAEGVLLYTAWSAGSKLTDKPTLELSNGSYDQATDSYVFCNDIKTYTYIVGNTEQKSSGTYLVVKKGDKIIYNKECK